MRHLDWKNKESLYIIVNMLREGRAIISSSDTVIGLLADTSKQGVQVLNTIKKRVEKPYILLVDCVQKVSYFVDNSHLFLLESFLKKCWPGPVTIIFKARADVPPYLVAPNGTIAIRIPNYPPLQGLLEHFDGLFSTSANITGQAIPLTIESVNSDVMSQVGAVINDDVKSHHTTQPSTILDATGDQIVVIREGAYAIDALEKLYGQCFKKN